ncbi:hypothetical protein PAPYR_9403 [Paratrimastix pyriformis]|uniref:F-box domain-containing protein n=1 Tax=Paratrimastix pyriformis TaxID=342808 RepID=A0ABQ8UCK8_9EUKA|nr:hypothetical protein PAPYR_9403 [Paratrimastix pyriformis]
MEGQAALFDQLPQEILPLIVENSGTADAFHTYLPLIGTSHLIRERLRGTLRSVSISDPTDNNTERKLGWAPDFSLPAETISLLLGPCKSLQDLTLGFALTRSGREEASYCRWIDVVFGGHPNIRSLRLSNEFCRSLTLGAIDRIFSHLPHLETLHVHSIARTRRWGEALFESLGRYCPGLHTLAYQNTVVSSNPCALQACRALRSLSLEYPDRSREARMALARGGWTDPGLPSDPQLEGVLSQLPQLEFLSTPDLGVVQAHPDLATRLDVPAWLQRRNHGAGGGHYPAAYPRLTRLRMQEFGTGCLPLLVAVAPHLRVFRANLQHHIDVGRLLSALQSAPRLSEVLLQSYPVASFAGLPELCARLEHFTMDSEERMTSRDGVLLIQSERLITLALNLPADLRKITVECPGLVRLSLPNAPATMELRCPALRRLQPTHAQRLVALVPMPALRSVDLRWAHQAKDSILWLDDLGAFPGLETLTDITLESHRWAQWLAEAPVARLGANIDFGPSLSEKTRGWKGMRVGLGTRGGAAPAVEPATLAISLAPALRELHLSLIRPPSRPLVIRSPTLAVLSLYSREVSLVLQCPALRTLGVDVKSLVLEGPATPPLERLRWQSVARSKAASAVDELARLLGIVAPTLTYFSSPTGVAWATVGPQVSAMPRLEFLDVFSPTGPVIDLTSTTLRRLIMSDYSPSARIEVHCPALESLQLYGGPPAHLAIDEAPYLIRLDGAQHVFDGVESAFPGVMLPPAEEDGDDQSAGSGDSADDVFLGEPFDD